MVAAVVGSCVSARMRVVHCPAVPDCLVAAPRAARGRTHDTMRRSVASAQRKRGMSPPWRPRPLWMPSRESSGRACGGDQTRGSQLVARSCGEGARFGADSATARIKKLLYTRARRKSQRRSVVTTNESGDSLRCPLWCACPIARRCAAARDGFICSSDRTYPEGHAQVVGKVLLRSRRRVLRRVYVAPRCRAHVWWGARQPTRACTAARRSYALAGAHHNATNCNSPARISVVAREHAALLRAAVP